jgi:hypothetical protein
MITMGESATGKQMSTGIHLLQNRAQLAGVAVTTVSGMYNVRISAGLPTILCFLVISLSLSRRVPD